MKNWPQSRKIVFVLFIWFLILLAAVLGDEAGNTASPKPQAARSGSHISGHPITPAVKRQAVRKPHKASRSVVRPAAIAPHTPAMRYAVGLVSDNQWACLSRLWHRESGWSPRSRTGSHFGIAQLRGERSTDPFVQVDNGLRYIENRYGSACKAWAHSQSTGWY